MAAEIACTQTLFYFSFRFVRERKIFLLDLPLPLPSCAGGHQQAGPQLLFFIMRATDFKQKIESL